MIPGLRGGLRLRWAASGAFGRFRFLEGVVIEDCRVFFFAIQLKFSCTNFNSCVPDV